MKDAHTWPRISIVTATYNQGAFIEETIQSVLSQDYPDLEYIIMDGGSTDETVDIIRRYESRLSYWVSEKDQGASDALQRGFARATGSILAYLNSDDLYLPGALFRVASAFVEKGGADLVYGHNYWIGPDGQRLGERRQAPFPLYGYLYGGADLIQPATFWAKEIYDRSGGIDPSFAFQFDVDMFHRFAIRDARFKCVRSHLSSFRIHPDSKSSTLPETSKKELDRIREEYLTYSIHSLPAKFLRNLSRVRRAMSYAAQGDLLWLLGRAPDRVLSRRSEIVVGPQARWK